MEEIGFFLAFDEQKRSKDYQHIMKIYEINSSKL